MKIVLNSGIRFWSVAALVCGVAMTAALANASSVPTITQGVVPAQTASTPAVSSSANSSSVNPTVDGGSQPSNVPISDTKTANSAPSQTPEMNAAMGVLLGNPSEAEKTDDASNKNTEDDGVPASVKGIVSRLDESTEETTVEDLNDARAAVARLDLLIDLEKRLGDLEQTRRDREEKKSESLAVSMAGLMPPPSLPTAAPVTPTAPLQAPPSVITEISVVRVMGASGARSVMLSLDGDKTVTVSVGDKLDDGTKIESIAPKSVVVNKDGKTRTLKVGSVRVVADGR